MKELILPPLVISLILFFGVQKFCIKRWGTKEVSSGWYWVGLLPLAFGILSYIIVIKRSVPFVGASVGMPHDGNYSRSGSSDSTAQSFCRIGARCLDFQRSTPARSD